MIAPRTLVKTEERVSMVLLDTTVLVPLDSQVTTVPQVSFKCFPSGCFVRLNIKGLSFGENRSLLKKKGREGSLSRMGAEALVIRDGAALLGT